MRRCNEVFLKIEGDRIADVKFQTLRCGAAIASSSMTTELIKGKTLEEAWKLPNKAVAEALDELTLIKIHCSVLPEEAIHEAINYYLRRKGLDPR